MRGGGSTLTVGKCEMWSNFFHFKMVKYVNLLWKNHNTLTVKGVSTKGGIAWPNVKCWFDPPPPNVCDIFRQKCVNHFWEWKCLIGVVKWSILGNKGTQCYPKGPYYRDRVLIRTFLAFWVPIGSLFILQGPYFQCFGFIHAKNVNSVCMYTAMS